MFKWNKKVLILIITIIGFVVSVSGYRDYEPPVKEVLSRYGSSGSEVKQIQ